MSDVLFPIEASLDALRQHAVLARAGEDPRGVHQTRVIASRIAAWLALGRRRVLLDDLRWLRRGLARARDLDVSQRREDLPAAVRAWLARERATEQPLVELIVESPRLTALLEAIEHLRAPSEHDARRAHADLVRRVLAAGKGFDAARASLTTAHRLRRRIRRLRQAREWMGATDARLRAAQTELGAINDLATAIDLLRASPFTVETEAWSVARARELEQALAHSRARWPALRAELRDE